MRGVLEHSADCCLIGHTSPQTNTINHLGETCGHVWVRSFLWPCVLVCGCLCVWVSLPEQRYKETGDLFHSLQ